MVLENLGEKLRETLAKITGSVLVDEKLVNELVKDIQRALLQSDVNVQLVFNLSKTIKQRALKEDPPAGMSRKEYLIKIVYDELVKFLGGAGHKMSVSKKPYRIFLVGLFGNGKTTTAGKLGKFFSKRGHKVALLQTDIWRPAAFEQLTQLGKQINVSVYGDPKLKDPVKIYRKFKEELDKNDVVIIDTAGRDALSDDLVEELNQLNIEVIPDEALLVISADIGQAAEVQAAKFAETCKVTGVIITKMEGTAKGGGALSACAVTNASVKFIGVGEKIDDLEEFNPERFVGRLLGMGDLDTLLEKAREAISEEKAEDLSQRVMKGDFNLIDLYEQMAAMKKMGSIAKLMEMIPGFSQVKLPKEALNVQEEKLKKWKHIMDSMTKDELDDPETVMNPKRIDRIAAGSGATVGDVRELLKQYRMSKKMIKVLKGGGKPDKLMRKFGGKMKGLGQMKGMGFGS